MLLAQQFVAQRAPGLRLAFTVCLRAAHVAERATVVLGLLEALLERHAHIRRECNASVLTMYACCIYRSSAGTRSCPLVLPPNP